MDIISYIGVDTASKFILPMVMKLDTTHDDIPKTFYKTCISIFDKPEFDDHIILVSTSKQDLLKCRYDLSLKKIWDDKEKNYLFIFEIPLEYEDDLYKIVTGDYTKLSEPYKKRLLQYWQEDNKSRLYGVLYGITNLAFSEAFRLTHRYEINRARSYYAKPTLRELIYGLGDF
jgi:hypothetical protein